MDNNIDNSNTGCWFCQEQSLDECGECPSLEGCGFWSDDFEEEILQKRGMFRLRQLL